MPVRPEHAAAPPPPRAKGKCFHHRQIEIDPAHDGDDGEHAHCSEEVAAALLHPQTDVQNVHRVHELLHRLGAVDAILAVKDRTRPHIVHDLLAAHTHMSTRGLPTALLDAEVQRPILPVRCDRQNLLRWECLRDFRRPLWQTRPNLTQCHGFPARRQIHRIPRIDFIPKEQRQSRQRQQQQKKGTDETHPLMDDIDFSHEFPPIPTDITALYHTTK